MQLTGLLAGAAIALGGVSAVNRIVEVDGVRYRVEVKGDVVTVSKKKLLVNWNMDERDRQRRAVQIATGCVVEDEFPTENAKLKGRLNCSTVATQP